MKNILATLLLLPGLVLAGPKTPLTDAYLKSPFDANNFPITALPSPTPGSSQAATAAYAEAKANAAQAAAISTASGDATTKANAAQAAAISSAVAGISTFADDPNSNENFETTNWKEKLGIPTSGTVLSSTDQATIPQATAGNPSAAKVLSPSTGRASFYELTSAIITLRTVYDRVTKIVERAQYAGVRSFTASASTDVVTLTAHGFLDGEKIALISGTSGSGLDTTGAVRYFVRDATANTFRLAATLGGIAVNITGDISAGTLKWASAPRLKCAAVGDSMSGYKSGVIYPLLQNVYGESSNQGLSSSQLAHAESGGATLGSDAFGLSCTGDYFQIDNSTGVETFTQGGGNVIADTLSFTAERTTTSGPFKVQINDGSGWTDLTSTLTTSVGSGVAYLNTTLTFKPGSYQFRFVSMGAAPVRIALQVTAEDKTMPGVQVYNLGKGGLNIISYGQLWSPSAASALLGELQLDMAMFEAKENSSYLEDALGDMQSVFDAANPLTNWIFIGSTPVLTNPTESADMIAQNEITRVHARSHGEMYTDGWTSVGGDAGITEQGWTGDAIHLTTTAHQYVANQLFDQVAFLFRPAMQVPFGSAGQTSWIGSTLRLFGSNTDPIFDFKPGSSGTSYDFKRQNTTGSRNFVNFVLGDGTPTLTLSFHANQAGSPSRLPNWFGWNNLGGTTPTFGVSARGDEIILPASNSIFGEATAFIRTVNTPRLTAQGSTTMEAGRIYESANSPNAYLLKASPIFGQINGVVGRNATWTITQPASTVIRCGPWSTTVGTGGSLTGGANDSVLLEWTANVSGVNEWRVIWMSPGVLFDGIPRSGTFTLSSGTFTVPTTVVDANTVIRITLKTASGPRDGNPDIVPTPGVGFTANGAPTDNSTYNWQADRN